MLPLNILHKYTFIYCFSTLKGKANKNGERWIHTSYSIEMVRWFVLISSWVTHTLLFFSFVWRIGPSPICLEYWVLLNRSNSLDPNCKIETNALPLFSLYTWELNLGKPYGIKLRCYWEHLEEQLEEPHNSNSFFFGNEPISLAYHQKTNKSWNYWGFQNRRFYGKMKCLPLAHLYRWKWKDFGQNICD
jgi:hypothetical protein